MDMLTKISGLMLLLSIPALGLAAVPNYSSSLSGVETKLQPAQTAYSSGKQAYSAGKQLNGVITKAATEYKKIPYMPRPYLSAYTGTTTVGQLDLLVPVLARYDRIFFAYGQGRYGMENKHNREADNTWTGSLGVGYRQIIHNDFILGGYLMGDYTSTGYNSYVKDPKTKKYTKSDSNNKVFMVSPGLELITQNWDFRLNGYFPMLTEHSWEETDWASDFGDYSHIIKDNHKVYDATFTYYEETGDGVDAEVGRNLFTVWHTLFKGYANGYFYKMNNNDNIMGGGVRLSIQPTDYLNISVSDSYDNYNKNAVMAGLRIDIYNMIFNRHSVNSADLQARLFAPIERNFGAIASGSNARLSGGPNDPSAKPVIKGPYLPTPPGPTPPTPKPNPHYIKYDDVWYFGPQPTAANGRIQGQPGTPQNPYTDADFNAKTLATIEAYAVAHHDGKAELYFMEGNTFSGFNNIHLPTLFALEGVQNTDGRPATGSDRPLFKGAFTLNTGDSLNNIRVENDGTQSIGITVAAQAQNVVLNDVDVGTGTHDNTDYATGISMQNANLTVSDSTINAYSTTNATGIDMQAGGVLKVDTGSTISVMADAATGTTSNTGNAYGIHADGSANQITINSSNISATATNNTTGSIRSGNGYGLLVGSPYLNSADIVQNNVVTVNGNSTISGSGTAANNTIASGNGYGVLVGNAYIDSNGVAGGSQTISGNTVTINATSTDGISGTGHSGDDSQFSGNAYGLLVGDGYAAAGTNKIDQDISGNILKISNAHFKATATISDATSNVKSGNSYGLLLGYGAAYNIVRSSQAEQDIKNNLQLTLSNSTFTTSSTTAASEATSGNSYGVLIGDGTVYNLNGTTATQSIDGNHLNINGSTITATSANGESAYGVLVGYGFVDGPSAPGGIDSNILIMGTTKSNTFTANTSAVIIPGTTSKVGGYAYGINFGRKSALIGSGNTIKIENSNINSETTTPTDNLSTRYGIWANIQNVDLTQSGNTFAYGTVKPPVGLEIFTNDKSVAW